MILSPDKNLEERVLGTLIFDCSACLVIEARYPSARLPSSIYYGTVSRLSAFGYYRNWLKNYGRYQFLFVDIGTSTETLLINPLFVPYVEPK